MNRRKYLAITACSVVPAIAGCSTDVTPSDMRSDDESDSSGDSDNSDGSGDSDQNSSSESDESGNEDEQENSGESTTAETVLENTNRIITELEWFENGYGGVIDAYRDDIGKVPTQIEPLITSLEEGGTITQEEMDQVLSIADDVAINAHSRLEPHFTDHYNHWAVNRAELDQADKYLSRGDWDVVESHLSAAHRQYKASNTGTAVSNRYPDDPITNRLFNWFRGGGDNKRMYEVTLQGSGVEGYSDRIDKYVLGVNADVTFDPMDSRTESEFDSTFSSFSEPAGREIVLKCKVHSVGSVSASSEIRSKKTDSIPVFCQGYADAATAKEAYELILEDKTVEATESWTDGGVKWDRVFFQGENNTEYVDMLQTGEYVYAVNPTNQSWERRGDNWYGLLANSWISPSN